MEKNHIQSVTISSMEFLPVHLNHCRPLPTFSGEESPEPDVRFLTSAGLHIPAHSSILASASKVLENILDMHRKNQTSEKIIPVLGVRCDAVVTFVRFLYLSSCTDEEMGKYGIHLLALSHVFSVSQLKQICIKGLAQRLTIENVVDVLQLARLCDAPDLYLRCMKFLELEFTHVQKTEGWIFLQDHDPYLELEILKFLEESESRKKQRRKKKEEMNLYMQLSEAMDCLEHICTEGCTNVRPYDKEPPQQRVTCEKFFTCRGLQLLIQHFFTCKKRVNDKCCCRCKRMWQLLRLHASMCDQNDECKVPLCRQFKMKMQMEKRRDDGRWKLLVRRVVSAKAMSSLSLQKQKERNMKAEWP